MRMNRPLIPGRGNLFRALWILSCRVKTTFTGQPSSPAAHLLGSIGLALRSTMYHPCSIDKRQTKEKERLSFAVSSNTHYGNRGSRAHDEASDQGFYASESGGVRAMYAMMVYHGYHIIHRNGDKVESGLMMLLHALTIRFGVTEKRG